MRPLATGLALLTTALTLCSAGAAPALAASRAPSGPRSPESYYLALGDSLSVGIQPNAHGTDTLTRQGYTYRLARTLRQTDPRLRLVDLGCSGETTATMINGGLCDYPPRAETDASGRPTPRPAGSQLRAATRFLRAHRGHVALVTIDIGANDLNPCVALAAGPAQQGTLRHIHQCVTSTATKAAANLARIMTALRAAGGSTVTIIGMTYYDPELAYWLAGPRGSRSRQIAQASVGLLRGYDGALRRVYAAARARVAHVFTAFDSTDFTRDAPVALPGVGTVPDNVAHICELTWECTRFHNEHANAAGYRVIARAFDAAYRSPPGP